MALLVTPFQAHSPLDVSKTSQVLSYLKAIGPASPAAWNAFPRDLYTPLAPLYKALTKHHLHREPFTGHYT